LRPNWLDWRWISANLRPFQEEQAGGFISVSLKPGRSRSSNNSVRGFLQRSKDAAVGFSAKVALNGKLRGIGEVTELSIDTKNKRIRLQLELVGETAPIEINITRYQLRSSEHGARLTIEEATASRPWLDTTLQQFVVGETFPVPQKVEALLKLLA
jgi:hypothetical protein